MSLRTQIANSRRRAALHTLATNGLSLDIHDPISNTRVMLQGKISAVTERAENAEGGFMLDHDAQARWLRTDEDGALNPIPVVGALVMRTGEKRSFRIDEIIDHPNHPEWKIGLGKVS